MKKEDFKELNDVFARAECPDNYICVLAIEEAPDIAKTYAKVNLLECLKCKSGDCDNLIHYSFADVCKCPLREMIAMNYRSIYTTQDNSI